MRIVRFLSDSAALCGVVEGETIRVMRGNPFGDFAIGGGEFSLNEVKLLPPVSPSKIIAVGLNYIDHAHELKMPVPDEPILFMKPSTSLLGPDGEIVYPKMAGQVDYEAELGVVIKDKIKDISVEDAQRHILGYTCANDVTARDLQRKDVQWTRAKSFDTFSPIGPWIETEIDPADLHIELLLNGEVKQSSSTSNMIFSVQELVSFVSKVMTLLPGDVIMTGTPPGIGSMQVGDIVEVCIEGIGVLRNPVAVSKL
ncbi:MAG TPA: hypothetical protein DCW86_01915 [Actinobacteria bacterium]|nr:hypothetical protein [Actinomycetota bacterium]